MLVRLRGLGVLAGVAIALASGHIALAVDNPTVTSVSPNQGSGDGGESVTILGSGFYCGTGGPVVQGSMNPYNGNNEPPPHDYLNVFFGPNAGIITSTPSDGKMTVTTPAGQGTVDVTVTCVTGNAVSSAASPADHYTYISSIGGAPSSHGDSALADSAGPSSLAQTGGGPAAHPDGNPWLPWALLLTGAMVAGGVLTRRLFVRR